jgi:tRNA pseudouridine32 synthase/23S rRNA pseudouridine746 synthase
MTASDADMQNTPERIESRVLVESADDNAIELLNVATGLPKQRIKIAMSRGAAWLTRGSNTQRLRRAKRALKVGDEINLYYDPEIMAESPPEPTLIADAGAYTVWRKPYGLRSQGSKWGDHCTVTRWAERNLDPERPAFTVHRLDRAANGLILVAHSKSSAAALSELFRERRIEKHYLAIVAGDFSSQASPVRVDEPIDEKDALSEISLREVSADGSQSLVEVRIETGRKHQIRRHLAGLGYPVIGDRLYGNGEADGVDLQLTAYLLSFQCPISGEPVKFKLSSEWLPSF